MDGMDTNSERQETRANLPFDFADRYEAYEAYDAILAAGTPPPGWFLDADAPLPELAETPGSAPQPWRPAPSLVSYGIYSTLTPGDMLSTHERQNGPLETNRRMKQVERETTQLMDRWQDNAMGATATGEASSASRMGASDPDSLRNAAQQVSAEQAATESLMPSEQWYTTRAARIGMIAGAATIAAAGLAGGITALVMRQRRMNAIRAMEKAIAASRLLRLTPAAARPDVMEATLAGSAATQHAQSAAAEAMRMARAMGRAATVTSSVARDYAQDRTSAAQDALNTVYSAARGGATGAWQNFAKSTSPAPRWVVRVFNAGRYTGRMEQRLK